MRVLLVAPPGAGKGTQGARLADHLGVSHIAAGDLLREQQRLGTPLGEQVRAIMAHGDLVPDDLMRGLVSARSTAPATDSCWTASRAPSRRRMRRATSPAGGACSRSWRSTWSSP